MEVYVYKEVLIISCMSRLGKTEIYYNFVIIKAGS